MPDYDRRLKTLRRWRDSAAKAGHLGGAVNDATLAAIARAALATSESVRGFISASLAEEVAVELERVDADPWYADLEVKQVDDSIDERTTERAPGSAGALAASKSSSLDALASLASGGAKPPSGTASLSEDSARESADDSETPPAPPRRVAPAEDLLELDGFAAYSYAASDHDPLPVRAARGRDGVLEYSWPPSSAAATVIYRVVSGEDIPPYNPDNADLAGATRLTGLRDERASSGAVRYVQVWAHAGVDLDDARATPPYLHAETAVVNPPQRFEIREDEGRVIARWSVPSTTARVHIFRVPVAEAARVGAHPAQFRIHADRENRDGFVDSEATRGETFVYHVSAEARVGDSMMLAPAVSSTVTVSDVLEQVTDLSVELRSDDETASFDVAWTRPKSGEVVIFRTQDPPAPGADAEALEESALGAMRLPPADRLPNPIETTEDGRAVMRDVPWPREWTRAYFTPVTFLNGMVFPGPTTPVARQSRIDPAKLVERVDRQMVVFRWPAGAASVIAVQGARGLSAADALASGTLLETAADEYQDLGCIPLNLPPQGCLVHLFPVTFVKGQRVQGEPTTLDYPGLLRLRYDVKQSRNMLLKVTGLSVTVSAAASIKGSPPFSLVYNKDRFPLSPTDGTVLTVINAGIEGAPPERFMRFRGLDTSWSTPWTTHPDAFKQEVPDSEGFVRLFVNLDRDDPTRVALLDPDPGRLRLAGGIGVPRVLRRG